MASGAIAGNENYDRSQYGTGLTLEDSRFSMQGGFITNNMCGGLNEPAHAAYYAGGPAIFTDSSYLWIHQADQGNPAVAPQITNNYSATGAGAIASPSISRRPRAFGSYIQIEGAYICGNTANAHEGGGIAVYDDTKLIIKKGYINDNRSYTNSDWGGGGIFVAQDGYAQIFEALITDNRAKGFGGGVSTCSTGQSYQSDDSGASIYDNKSDAAQVTVENAKPWDNQFLGVEGHLQGMDSNSIKNEMFRDKMKGNGNYSDFFGFNDSFVINQMLGGGRENWKGVYSDADSDDNVISNTKEIDFSNLTYKKTNKFIALKANPSDNDKIIAKKCADVFIRGNYSGVHGGGIMSNGSVVFGSYPSRNELQPVAFYVRGMKVFNGEGSYLTDVKTAPTFKFGLYDSGNNSIGTAQINGGGLFAFAKPLKFDQSGSYTYFIKEESGDYSSILFDQSIYRLDIQVGEDEKQTINLSGENITITPLEIKSSKVVKLAPDAKSGVAAERNGADIAPGRDYDSDHPEILSFTNTYKPYQLKITKKNWSGQALTGAVFKLEINGESKGTHITNSDGNLRFNLGNLKDGDEVILTETKAPEGYLEVAPMHFKAYMEKGQLVLREEKEGSTSIIGDDKGDKIVYQLTVTDPTKNPPPPTGNFQKAIPLFIGIVSMVAGLVYYFKRPAK